MYRKKGWLGFCFYQGWHGVLPSESNLCINLNLRMLVWILPALRVYFIVNIRDSDIGDIQVTHNHQFFPWMEKVALDFIAAWYISVKKQLFSYWFSVTYKNLIVWFFMSFNSIVKQVEEYIIEAWCVCIIIRHFLSIYPIWTPLSIFMIKKNHSVFRTK